MKIYDIDSIDKILTYACENLMTEICKILIMIKKYGHAYYIAKKNNIQNVIEYYEN